MERGRKPGPRLSLASVVGLALLALVATGCGLTPTHTPRASDQWSNGKLLGTAILNNPVALQVDEAGNSFMVWIGLEHELHFARLNEQAEVVVQAPLDLHTTSAMKPQLTMDTTDQLHLTWLDKEERTTQLFYARLSADGEVIQEATVISPPERRVTHSSMVIDPVGQTVELFWSDNVYVRPGCYHATLYWSGTVVVPAEMLIPDGLLPAAQIDRQGFVHLAWRVELEPDEPTFHYAVYDPQRRMLGPDIPAVEPLIQMSLFGGPTAGASFDGPWLGLDESSVYLAWVPEMRERTTTLNFTFYQAFPQPALNQHRGEETFDYPPPEVTSEAVQVQGVDPTLTGQPRFLEGQPAHQVLTCFTQTPGPGNIETLQIAVVDVGAEQVEGQEIVNASAGASVRPSVAMDGRGNLHLAWIDTAGFERYHVVYASTSSEAKEALNRLTTYDVVNRVLGWVMSFLSSLFFIPVLLNWILIPLGWLALFTLATRESEISDPHGRRALILAILLQLATKTIFFPDLLSRSPLTSLLSPPLGLILGRWIIPSLLAAISAGAMWAYLKRERSQSIFVSYFIYAAVDSLLTLVVYVAPLMT